jgi:hypothetical protein
VVYNKRGKMSQQGTAMHRVGPPSVEERIALWMASGSSLDPRALHRVSVDVDDARELAIEVMRNVDAGNLSVVYKVIAPTGEASEVDFDNPREIPPQLRDSANRLFATSSADIIPFYKVS